MTYVDACPSWGLVSCCTFNSGASIVDECDKVIESQSSGSVDHHMSSASSASVGSLEQTPPPKNTQDSMCIHQLRRLLFRHCMSSHLSSNLHATQGVGIKIHSWNCLLKHAWSRC